MGRSRRLLRVLWLAAVLPFAAGVFTSSGQRGKALLDVGAVLVGAVVVACSEAFSHEIAAYQHRVWRIRIDKQRLAISRALVVGVGILFSAAGAYGLLRQLTLGAG